MRRAIGIAALLATVVLGTGATMATAEYPTQFKQFKLETDSGGGEATGKIGSTKGRCIKNRKVKVFRKQNGDKHKLGSDKTNDEGRFEIGLPSLTNGKYFGEVKEKNLADTSTGEAQVCLSHKSAKVTLS